MCFELFSYHGCLGFLTNFDDRFPAIHCHGALRRLFDTPWWHVGDGPARHVMTTYLRKFVPRRTEAYRFWTQTTRADFYRSWLWDMRASAAAARRAQKAAASILKWQKKQCLATKFTGPGRIAFLRSLFPDARFVHVVREPLPQIGSLLRVGFWMRGEGARRLWWRNDIPPAWEAYLRAAERTRESAILAAAQWRAVVGGIRMEAEKLLPPADYVEVSYESVVADARAAVRQLWQAMDLPLDARALARVAAYPIRAGRNAALLERLPRADREQIRDWLERPAAAAVDR